MIETRSNRSEPRRRRCRGERNVATSRPGDSGSVDRTWRALRNEPSRRSGHSASNLPLVRRRCTNGNRVAAAHIGRSRPSSEWRRAGRRERKRPPAARQRTPRVKIIDKFNANIAGQPRRQPVVKAAVKVVVPGLSAPAWKSPSVGDRRRVCVPARNPASRIAVPRRPARRLTPSRRTGRAQQRVNFTQRVERKGDDIATDRIRGCRLRLNDLAIAFEQVGFLTCFKVTFALVAPRI